MERFTLILIIALAATLAMPLAIIAVALPLAIVGTVAGFTVSAAAINALAVPVAIFAAARAIRSLEA